MAEKTSVTKAYGSARLAREKAEKILNGTAGRGGLESAWLRIQGRYADRNKPGYFNKQITEEYNLIKIDYEKTAKEYQDALALETKYKEELDAVAKKENKTKIVQDAADKLAKAKAEKAKADSVVPSRGQEQATAAATAVTDAQAAYDEAKGQSSTSTSNKPTTPQEDYAGYTLDPSTGAVYGPGVEGQNGLQGLFVPMPDSKGNVVNQFVTSSNRAVEGFLKQYQGPGQLEQLKKKLLDSGYIKQSQFSGTAWLSGLVDMFKNYSSDYLYKIKFENATDVPGIDVFMTQKKPGSGTGGIPVRVITTRGEAKTLLDGYMSDLIGRPSTAEEESVFYEQLHKAENKATRTTVGGTITGSVLTEADRLMIAAKVARKTLRGSNVDELLKSNIGSTVALDIASMQKYAAKYGIDMTPAEALKRVADGIGQENYAAKQQERLRQLSMTLHPYLKEHIAAGGTVQDVADAYAYTKSTKLGVAIPTSTKDKDIMKAIASGKTIADFDRELQADPLWRRTDEARKLSSDFTSTMLKTFGLG
jgi:hypothetical protein